jgi:hypothetical protein
VLFEKKLIRGLIEMNDKLKLDGYAFENEKKPAYIAILTYLKDFVKQVFTNDDGKNIEIPFKQSENLIFNLLPQRIFDIIETQAEIQKEKENVIFFITIIPEVFIGWLQ